MNPTECGVSECDREASIMRRPWPARGCCVIKEAEHILLYEGGLSLRETTCIPLSLTNNGKVIRA